MVVILGTVATAYGLASVGAPLLQLRRMCRTGSSNDLSLGNIALGVTGSVIWLAYGVALGNVALILVDLGTMFTGAATLAVAVRLRRRRVTPHALPHIKIPSLSRAMSATESSPARTLRQFPDGPLKEPRELRQRRIRAGSGPGDGAAIPRSGGAVGEPFLVTARGHRLPIKR